MIQKINNLRCKVSKRSFSEAKRSTHRPCGQSKSYSRARTVSRRESRSWNKVLQSYVFEYLRMP